jgi:hypothetical protein
VGCQSSEKIPPDGVFSQSFANTSSPVTAIHFLASTIEPRLRRRPANARYGSRTADRRQAVRGQSRTLAHALTRTFERQLSPDNGLSCADHLRRVVGDPCQGAPLQRSGNGLPRSDRYDCGNRPHWRWRSMSHRRVLAQRVHIGILARIPGLSWINAWVKESSLCLASP